MKHRVATGRNFDIVCGSDLTIQSEQRAFMEYRKRFHVQVIIMAPICGPFGGWSQMNRRLYPETWQEHYDYAYILGRFCGEVALAQDDDDLDWLAEQPVGSELYDLEPWPQVRARRRTTRVKFDQCQCNAKTSWGQSIKKATEIWASDGDLTYYLEGLRCGAIPEACNGDHYELRGTELRAAQVWPWQMAARISWGILRLLQRRKWQQLKPAGVSTGHSGSSFPAVSSSAAPAAAAPAARDEPEAWRQCPGCRRRRPDDHEDHTRIQGHCLKPNVQTVIYPCPACRAGRPMMDSAHTNSDAEANRCRNSVRAARGGRQGGPRAPRQVGVRPVEHRRVDPRLAPIPELPEPPEQQQAAQQDIQPAAQ